MDKLKFLKQIYELLKNPNQDSLKLSMTDVHHNNIFSLVIKGTEFGELTRVFIANEKLKPFDVQLHTHRYPIKLTTIKGNIKHYVAFRSEIMDAHTVSLSEFEYKSPLNGGSGLKYDKETNVIIKDYSVPVGSTLEMDYKEFHTMSCSKNSIWIVEEQGFKTDTSRVLGVPFVTDELYNEPKSFQVNDNCQLVAREIKKMILDYELV
tara:strand:- start:57 stop:677 length:621 start_codon:yes stop_codon:yes gene_type:complete